MARVKTITATRKRHKRVLKAAKGFYGGRGTQYRMARNTVKRAWKFATEHRRMKKRDFRRLWIAKISAATRESGLTYSKFMNGLKKAKIDIDRKILSNLAVTDRKAFGELVELAKTA